MNNFLSSLSLQTETDQDILFLQQLYAQIRAAEMAFFPWSEEQKSAFLQMQFGLQHKQYRENYSQAEFSIILMDNNPIGRWYLNRDSEIFHLIDIGLLPDYRHQGIGSYLLKKLLTEAQLEQKTVRLHVEPVNPALKLYQQLGFIAIEEHGFHWLMEWKA